MLWLLHDPGPGPLFVFYPFYTILIRIKTHSAGNIS